MSVLLRAILLMVTAMLCFALADLCLKLAARSLPIGQVMLALGIGVGIIFATILKIQNEPLFQRDFWNRAVMLRNGGEVWASIFMFQALAFAPLSTVSVIMQTLPLCLILTAALFLKEKVGIRRISAVLVGFIGAIIVIRPGFDDFNIYSGFAILGVLGMAARDTGSHITPASISTNRLSFYGAIFITLTGIMILAATEPPIWPEPAAWGFLTGLCILATFGFITSINAMRMVDVSIISPFRYTRIIFALIIGIFILDETVDMLTAIGSVMIVGAGLYSWLREQHLARHGR